MCVKYHEIHYENSQVLDYVIALRLLKIYSRNVIPSEVTTLSADAGVVEASAPSGAFGAGGGVWDGKSTSEIGLHPTFVGGWDRHPDLGNL